MDRRRAARRLTAKYAKGVDVFVTELQPDLSRLNMLKYGLPEFLYNYTVDIHHTVAYAAGYLINQVNPRVGMATHLAFDDDTLNEQSADIRAHWKGLFLYGAPDVVTLNVTKDRSGNVMYASIPRAGILYDPRVASTGYPLTAKPQGCCSADPRVPAEQQARPMTRDLKMMHHGIPPGSPHHLPNCRCRPTSDFVEMAKVMGIDISKFKK